MGDLLGGMNGHEAALPSVPELQALALRVATSEALSRIQWAQEHGFLADGRSRNLDKVLGYPSVLTPDHYTQKYRRGDVAGRIVEVFPNACWRGGVEVIENENPATQTAFEQDLLAINKRLALWTTLWRVDKMSQLGEYATLLIGGAPTDFSLELQRGTGPDSLWYLQPWGQAQMVVLEYDENPSSRRFGQPQYYQLKRTTGRRLRSGSARFNPAAFDKKIHWSRVIHVAENCLDNDVFGLPRLERVFNRLLDLDKVAGGGSEAFWLRAHQGLHINVDPKTKIPADKLAEFKADLRRQVEEYENEMRRAFTTQGTEVSTLGSDVAQFNTSSDALLTLIAGALGVPKRILTGSEMGELASSQDRDNWRDQVHGRQTQHVEPRLIRASVDRFLAYGFVRPTAAGVDYQVRFAEQEVLSQEERNAKAESFAGVNSTYGDVVFTDAEIREVQGKEPLTETEKAKARPTPPEPPALPDPSPTLALPPGQPEAKAARGRRPAQRAMQALVADIEAAILARDLDKLKDLIRA